MSEVSRRQRAESGLELRQLFEVVSQSGLLPDEETPEHAVKAILCTITDRLSEGEARHLTWSLPESIRRYVINCSVHPQAWTQKFDLPEFLRRTSWELGVSEESAASLARLIFQCVRRWLPPDVIDHVSVQLPGDLRGLWLGSAEDGDSRSPAA